jgi:hypothetical protein
MGYPYGYIKKRIANRIDRPISESGQGGPLIIYPVPIGRDHLTYGHFVLPFS